MHNLKIIILAILKDISKKRESNGSGETAFRNAFYFKDVVNQIGVSFPDKKFSKDEIKSDLKALIKEGTIKQINTCTPMFLLPENHLKYFEKKHSAVLKIKKKSCLQKLFNIFPDAKLSDNKETLFVDVTISEFDSFKWMHKDLSSEVELKWA